MNATVAKGLIESMNKFIPSPDDGKIHPILENIFCATVGSWPYIKYLHDAYKKDKDDLTPEKFIRHYNNLLVFLEARARAG